MKKIPVIFVFVIFAMFLCSFPISAVEPMKAKIEAENGQPGTTAEVKINVENNPGVSAISFDIIYDDSLILKDVKFNDALGGQTVTSQQPFKSPVIVKWVNALGGGWSEDGTFVTLTFEISGDAAYFTDAMISLTYDPDNIYNSEEINVNVETEDAKVEIIPLAGDINGDGRVGSKDVTRLFQHQANWDVYVNEFVLDVNGDEKLNSKDITRLFQYLANWPVKIYYTKVHTHSYSDWTYADEFTHSRRCSCGDKEVAEHGWDDGVVTKEPTCKEEGIKTYTCFVCGGTKTESIPVTDDHKYGAFITVDERNHKHACEICGKEELLAHAWDDGVVTKAPTCKEEGIKTYTCSECGGTKTESIPVTSCKWDNGVVTKAPTCKDTGIKTYTCSVCGKTKTEEIPKTDIHNYGEYVKVDDKTHKRICSVCGREEVSNHNWDNGTVTKKATCTEDGEMTYRCTVCGYTKTESINKGEHKWSEEKITDATQTEFGERTYKCSVCGQTKTEKIPSEYIFWKGTEDEGKRKEEMSDYGLGVGDGLSDCFGLYRFNWWTGKYVLLDKPVILFECEDSPNDGSNAYSISVRLCNLSDLWGVNFTIRYKDAGMKIYDIKIDKDCMGDSCELNHNEKAKKINFAWVYMRPDEEGVKVDEWRMIIEKIVMSKSGRSANIEEVKIDENNCSVVIGDIAENSREIKQVSITPVIVYSYHNTDKVIVRGGTP